MVKYAWPMPHQAADSIPWVKVTLASGETVQTKLLVSLIPSTQTISLHFFKPFLFFTFAHLFSDWCRRTKLNGAPGPGDTHSQVEL